MTQDADDFSEWDFSPSSRFTTSASAGLNGTAAGIERDISGSAGDGNVQLSSLSSGAVTIIRAGFYWEKNTLSLLSGEYAAFLSIINDNGAFLFYVEMRNTGSGDFLRCSLEDDGASFTNVDTAPGDMPGTGEHTVEIVIVQPASTSSNDGTCTIYVDTVQVAQVTTLDNHTVFEDTLDGLAVLTLSGFQSAAGADVFYFDEIIVRDDSTFIFPPALATAFRFLGFAADNENLYASGLKDGGTLQLFDYDLPTLTESGTASFGSGTDAELDALVRGIFPVVKPMADQVLYLRGRDGNNVQVQYNDQNGTLGWVDIGPGTATWGTDKYAVGLLTAPTYTDDVIAVFSDDDVYRTRFGTQTWVKMGDAGTNLLAAARHPTRFNEIMVAGTAAGTVEWSNNFGASFGDVSGTALGTVNAFEVSL
jgi:hypothetical protein